MIKNMVFLMGVLLLTGCVNYKWVKAGQSDQQMQRAMSSCQAKSLVQLPPNHVVQSSRTNKDKKDGDKKVESNTYNSISDANESKREILFNDCMYSQGWERVVVQ